MYAAVPGPKPTVARTGVCFAALPKAAVPRALQRRSGMLRRELGDLGQPFQAVELAPFDLRGDHQLERRGEAGLEARARMVKTGWCDQAACGSRRGSAAVSRQKGSTSRASSMAAQSRRVRTSAGSDARKAMPRSQLAPVTALSLIE